MLSDPMTRDAITLSLLTAFAAATMGLPPAIAIGYRLARSKSRGKWLAESIVHLPLVMPPVVTGYLLLLLLSPNGWIGRPIAWLFGAKIVFTSAAPAIAALVVSLPLSIRAMRLAFEGVDPRLEQAARSLGAGPLRVFFAISLPLARRGLITGWFTAFARSLGEFGATIMIAGNIPGRTQTIPLAIFSTVSSPGGMEHAWKLVAIALILSCIAMAVGEAIAARSTRYAT